MLVVFVRLPLYWVFCTIPLYWVCNKLNVNYCRSVYRVSQLKSDKLGDCFWDSGTCTKTFLEPFTYFTFLYIFTVLLILCCFIVVLFDDPGKNKIVGHAYQTKTALVQLLYCDLILKFLRAIRFIFKLILLNNSVIVLYCDYLLCYFKVHILIGRPFKMSKENWLKWFSVIDYTYNDAPPNFFWIWSNICFFNLSY